MDDQQALDIVSALANGTNPVTGEVFVADSPYQSSIVIRALFVAQRALEAQLRAGHAPTNEPMTAGSIRKTASVNAGKQWSAEEDKQLLAAFDADRSLADIARDHARTVGGVRARLEKHGRLEPSPTTRWPQTPTHSDQAARPRQSLTQGERGTVSS